MSLRNRFWNAVFPKHGTLRRACKPPSGKRQRARHSFESLEHRWALTGEMGSVWAANREVLESSGVAVVNVWCSGHESEVTVDYSTASGSAVSGSDFTGVSGALTFAPGQTSKAVTVPITNDTTAEDAESFAVQLSNAVRAQVVGGPGTVTISVNDHAPVITSFSLSHGGGWSWTIYGTVSDADGNCVGSPIDFGGVLAGYDLNAEVESDGSFLLVADLENLAAGTATAQTTDSEDLDSNVAEYAVVMPMGHVDITAISVAENIGWANVTVTCWGHAAPVTVEYQSTDDFAEAGYDYNGISGVLTFSPTQTQKTLLIQIVNDTAPEVNESFVIDLSNVTGGDLYASYAAVTILINDQAPVITAFTITQVSGLQWKIEGHVTDADESVAGFTVRLAGNGLLNNLTATVDSNGDFSLDYQFLAPPSGTYTAQTTDYQGLNSNVMQEQF